METIQVRDRSFAPFLSAEEIQTRVAELGAKISAELQGKRPLFLAVLSGSFIFAADLLRAISIPCEIAFIRVSSYEGTGSTGQVKQLMGLKEDIAGRTVVVVEDIIDSGLTMKELLGILAEKNPAEVKIASLLVKPGNMQVELDIPYRCFDIPNDFIVGYGLDYDGEGRNLPAIYKVTE
ncbi:MAG: hypoxanthine phosphoribosyltransferase [Bacteroidales bacterium]|nr:hypoxanthine phosphoribosyltransferase [Bacteroidales bacterium]